MGIRYFQDADADELLRVRCGLFGEAQRDELRRDDIGVRAREPRRAVFVAEREGGGLCGFLEVSLRDYADGCESSPVGYLEEWFVDADVRRSGTGGRLVAAGEEWARALGCSEMASDTQIDNLLSQVVHDALGYRITERLVVFAKRL